MFFYHHISAVGFRHNSVPILKLYLPTSLSRSGYGTKSILSEVLPIWIQSFLLDSLPYQGWKITILKYTHSWRRITVCVPLTKWISAMQNVNNFVHLIKIYSYRPKIIFINKIFFYSPKEDETFVGSVEIHFDPDLSYILVSWVWVK